MSETLFTADAIADGFDSNRPYMRPLDAASLIILDTKNKNPKVLMGLRSAGHKFMPNLFVFPGGRVDVSDTRLKQNDALHPKVMRRLRARTRKNISDRRLQAFALAAIRETYEETGLLLGAKTKHPLQSRHPVWGEFFQHGIAPSLTGLDFLGRAITPTRRVRRYDTRFFIARAEQLYQSGHKLKDDLKGDGELLDVRWLSFAQARKQSLPLITRYVLEKLEARLALPPAKQIHAPSFFLSIQREQHHIKQLR